MHPRFIRVHSCILTNLEEPASERKSGYLQDFHLTVIKWICTLELEFPRNNHLSSR